MTSDRKKPGVTFWATVIVAVVLAYPLSFGPACWLTNQGFIDGAKSGPLYRPILRLCVQKSGRVSDALRWYGLLDTHAGQYMDSPDGIMDSMLFGK